jgi:tRNA(fMet)-specific endonuclease VapC
MTRYMLDTNTVSHLIRQHPALARRVVAASMASLCLSAITAGELLFGLAKRPDAVRLHRAVTELLRRVDVLPWDNGVARCYGGVRADMERRGRPLGPLDLLIAAHARSVGAVLVTNDQAFGQVAGLAVEDWTL